jgi:peptide-methionine (R)-S-oxide reductase
MSTKTFEVVKSDEEWKKELGNAAYAVIRGKGTEPARTGEYDKFYPTEGYFACRACGNPLYSAASKFNSGCGWPGVRKHCNPESPRYIPILVSVPKIDLLFPPM